MLKILPHHRFENDEELNCFRKLSGHTLFCDPVLSHFLIDQQTGFLREALAWIGTESPWSPEERVLEAGCGAGYKIGTLSRLFGFKGYGCDTSERFLPLAGESLGPQNLFRHDIRFPFTRPDFFKCIFTCMTLQHIENKDSALKNIHESLMKGGYFIMVETCSDHPLVKRRARSDKSFLLRSEEYQDSLEKTGFQTLRISSVVRPPLLLLFSNFPFWARDYHAAETFKKNYRPKTFRNKLARFLIELTIKHMNEKPSFLFPTAQIGILCRKL